MTKLWMNLIVVVGLLCSPVGVSLVHAANKSQNVVEQKEPSLKEQAQDVKNYIEGHKNVAVRLVLGVAVPEGGLSKIELQRFFPEEFNTYYLPIFLDDLHDLSVFSHNSKFKGRILKADFNNLEQLEIIADELNNSLDQIVVDDSTHKFTSWNFNHYRLFAKILKKGGQLIFAPEGKFTTNQFGDISLKGELKKVYLSEKDCKGLVEIFGKGNVKAEHNMPLPFKSNSLLKQEVLITATKE